MVTLFLLWGLSFTDINSIADYYCCSRLCLHDETYWLCCQSINNHMHTYTFAFCRLVLTTCTAAVNQLLTGAVKAFSVCVPSLWCCHWSCVYQHTLMYTCTPSPAVWREPRTSWSVGRQCVCVDMERCVCACVHVYTVCVYMWVWRALYALVVAYHLKRTCSYATHMSLLLGLVPIIMSVCFSGW